MGFHTTLWSTLWRQNKCHAPRCGVRSATSTPQRGALDQTVSPLWTNFVLQCADPSARGLAGAFKRWAQGDPELVGNMINSQWVRQLYTQARRPDWPCYRDFAKELGLLMRRRRVWRSGKGLTVYVVLPAGAEVVAMPERLRA